jgi:hypothetical protein
MINHFIRNVQQREQLLCFNLYMDYNFTIHYLLAAFKETDIEL